MIAQEKIGVNIFDRSVIFFVGVADDNRALVVVTWVRLVEELWSENEGSVGVAVSDGLSVRAVQWQAVVSVEDWLSGLVVEGWPAGWAPHLVAVAVLQRAAVGSSDSGAVLSAVDWSSVLKVELDAAAQHWERNLNGAWGDDGDWLGSVARDVPWDWDVMGWQGEGLWQVGSFGDVDWDPVISEWHPDWLGNGDWGGGSHWHWLRGRDWHRDWLWVWDWLWVRHWDWQWVGGVVGEGNRGWVGVGVGSWLWLSWWKGPAWSVDDSSPAVQQGHAVGAVEDSAGGGSPLWLSPGVIEVVLVFGGPDVISPVVLEWLSVRSLQRLAVVGVPVGLTVLVVVLELTLEVVRALSVGLVAGVIFPDWVWESVLVVPDLGLVLWS